MVQTRAQKMRIESATNKNEMSKNRSGEGEQQSGLEEAWDAVQEAWSTVQEKLSTVTPLQWAAVAAPLIFGLSVLAFPVFRWNLALYAYMPTLSGLYIDLSPWFLPSFQSYLRWELSTFPHLFAGDAEKLGHVQTTLVEIDASEYSYELFLERTDNMRKAAVIRGVFANSTAVKTFGKPEWIQAHNEFHAQTVLDIDKSGDKYEYVLQSEPFVDFMADLRAGKVKYSYGLDEIYTRYPELVSDVELERLGRHNGRDYNFCQSIALFISGSAKGLRWHNANHANLAVQLQGSKRFHLLDPHYSVFMGPDGNRDPYATGFAAQSPMDIINQLPEFNVVLNAGDAIFTPVWWWHAVETEADPETGLAMLNTCRFGSISSSMRNNYVLELFRHTGFINWLHPKMPLAARFIPYFRVFQDGIREIFNAMPYWDAPDCYSSKRAACEKYFTSVGWDISDYQQKL